MPPERAAPPLRRGGRLWTAGTLTYSVSGLAILVLWLLWGDLAWWMRERSALPMVQLLLKRFDASDFLTGLFLITVPNLIWVVLGPVVSYRSDNHRGPWGRRIPYLLATTPLVTAAMIGLGFSGELGALLHHGLGDRWGTQRQAVLLVIGLSWTLFEAGALSANAVFLALINDVVPRRLIGRFFGIFRAVSLGTGIFFNSEIIGRAERHMRLLFVGIGCFYAAGLLLMCFGVREGEYPPPPPAKPGSPLVRAVAAYFKDCFTQPYYLWGIAFLALGNLAFVPVNTFVIAAAKSYGMGMDTYGRYFVAMYLTSFALAFPLGWMADRFHPLRVGNASVAAFAVGGALSFLFIRSAATFGVALLAHGIISGCFFTGTASLGQVIFPKLKFAQFAAAATLVNSLCQVLMGPVLGGLLDLTGSQYRYAFLAESALCLAALFAGRVLLRSQAPDAPEGDGTVANPV